MPQIDAPPVDDAEKLKLNDVRRIPCFRNSMMYGFGGKKNMEYVVILIVDMICLFKIKIFIILF